MIRNISLYIKDILQNMHDAEEFIQGLSYDGFVADKRTFNAVARSLEVIGEGPRTFQMKSAQDIPWFPGRKWQE
jgi:uncharacterized protein with HEPN domain